MSAQESPVPGFPVAKRLRACAVLIEDHAFAPVPIAWLVLFRATFGITMLWYSAMFLATGSVDRFYSIPPLRFPYDGAAWIAEIDWPIMINRVAFDVIHLEYAILAGCALLILLGWFYRAAALVFAVLFTHVFLLDRCYYQNHYYLIALIAWQLPFLPAHRAWSADVLLGRTAASNVVPRWTMWLARFTIGVPYFYGGIAKLNSDWLLGQPMRMALRQRSHQTIFGGDWMAQEWFVQTIVWGGLLFDLLVVPALLNRRTRGFAFLLTLGFHLTNAMIWSIGIFPWFMIPATTVFFEPDWPRRLFRRGPIESTGGRASFDATGGGLFRRRVTLLTLAVYVAWQVLFPLRHLVMPGNPHWDEYTHHFSWHMMLRAKECGLRIYATDPRDGRSGSIDLRNYVTGRQLAVISRDPRMIHRLCLYIKDDLNLRGFPDVELRALSLVSLNGRKPQLLIDPTVDLAAQPLDDGYPSYVVPLTEPYRHDGWEHPLNEWERRLDLRLPPQMNLPGVPERKVSGRVTSGG